MTLRIVGGTYKGRILKTQKRDTTRPTTSMARAAIFNRCQHLIEHAEVLDLFAGSGAIGFEALSRGAKHVTFVEKDRNAAACIKENGHSLNVEQQYTLLQMDAGQALTRLKKPFDFIYIDPPYDLEILSLLEDIGAHQLLKKEGVLFFEERHHKKSPPHLPNLVHIDSRRYGEAFIHQYHTLEQS